MIKTFRELNSFHHFLAFLTLAAVIFGSTASATQIDWESNQIDPAENYVVPGSENNTVMQFTILDGNDTELVNTTEPGDDLYSFENNRTMFINQSYNPTSGLEGFDAGDAIMRVSRVHSESKLEIIDGEVLRNFSSNVYFADGGNKSDGLFNGDQEAGNNSEAVLIDNTSDDNHILDEKDFVLAEGRLNFSNFSDDVVFVNSSTSDLYDGSQAILRTQTGYKGFLNETDEVLREGEAGLTEFSSTVRYVDFDEDGSYEDEAAIIDEEAGSNSKLLEEEDEVVVNGSADLESAHETWLSYFNSTTGGFQNRDEPIYYEGSDYDNLVNTSDVRIGEVEISVNEGLNVLRNDTLWNASLEIGKKLYNVTDKYTGYGGNGSFRVLEYNTSGSDYDNTWNPASGDQEVIIYDPSGDFDSSISGDDDISDIYVYDSNPGRTTIPNSMELGDRFSDEEAGDVNKSYNSYKPDVNLTFDGSDRFYNTSKDNVTLNVSYGGENEVVILGPEDNSGELGYEDQLHDGGYFRFWNTTNGGSDETEGIYADMDKEGVANEGDLRLGGWTKTKSAGTVSDGDVDIGINLTEFKSSDDVKVVNADHSSSPIYDAGNGKLSDENGREAIIVSQNNKLDSLDSGDELVRSGSISARNFDTGTRFTDFDQDGVFEGSDAIVEDGGNSVDLLEVSDSVLRSGNASLTNLSEEVRYVENGTEPGFEQNSSEAILWDTNTDGEISTGFLNNTPDKVLNPGHANLMNFSRTPNSQGETGKVFVDSNNTERYNQGEEILNVTLLRNGTVSGNISGETIYNFADTTRHSGSSTYQSGDAIINDTDNNQVFQDVFEGLGVENVYKASSYFKQNLTDSELVDGEIDVYRKSTDGGSYVGALSPAGDLKWGGSFSENITEDSTFYLSLDIVSSGLNDLVYGMKFESYSIDNAGNSLTLSDCSDSAFACKQRLLDNHAPELNFSYTGYGDEGNSSQRDKIYIDILEVGAGLKFTFDYADFNISSPEHNVTKAEFVNSQGDIRLTLNDTLETNETPKVGLVKPNSRRADEGQIKDDANNLRGNDTVETNDGLRPLIEDVGYLDEDVDGTLDGLELVFSERVNYSSFDGAGWDIESNGIPCLQAQAPGKEASFCSTNNRNINVTSGTDSSVFQKAVDLASMDYVNSSSKNSSEYEIGGGLYNVTDSNTGYGENGSFVVHEFNTSGGDSDGVWNPNETKDQDVLVYSVNGTDLTPGDILIYDESSSNDNITIDAGEEFSRQDVVDSEEPVKSYRVNATTGYTGSGSFSPEENNVTVNISYNSSEFDEPNSTFVSLAPEENAPGLGISEGFNEAGNVKFWNTSGSTSDPGVDGLFVDVNETGNISKGDVRLGEWTLQEEKKLYSQEIDLEVGADSDEETLNNTLLNLSSGNIGYINMNSIVSAEVTQEDGKINVTDNITDVEALNGGNTLNISFDTVKERFTLNQSDMISLKYYSRTDLNMNHVEALKLNSDTSGGIYDRQGTLNQDNTSVVELNATALESVTGTSVEEPVVNFTVLNNLVSDQSGNTLTNATGVTLTDKAGPAVVEASTEDEDNDVEVDRIDLEFSEDLDDTASGYGSAFNLSNGTIRQVQTVHQNDSELELNVTEVGGTAFTPNLTIYNNTVYDASGNSPGLQQNFTEVQDRANPILLNAEIDPVNSSSEYSFIDMQFSENTSGTEADEEQINISGEDVYFNSTTREMNLSVKYSSQLQTGDTPNITLSEGLTDDSGNALELFEEDKVPVNTFRREMVEGWNFVSFPIATDSTPNITEILDVSKVELVWTRKNDGWATYDPEAPENPFNTVRGGKGYYIKAKENHTLASNVENKVESSVTGSELQELGVNISSGWNLIGNIQEYRQEPKNQTAFVSFDARVDPVLGQKYRNGSKVLETSPPLKEDDGTINGGMKVSEAYWVDVSDPGENATYRVPVSDIP